MLAVGCSILTFFAPWGFIYPGILAGPILAIAAALAWGAAQPDEKWKRVLAWMLFAAEGLVWYTAISFAILTIFRGDDDWQIGLVLTPLVVAIALAVRWARRRWIRFGLRTG